MLSAFAFGGKSDITPAYVPVFCIATQTKLNRCMYLFFISLACRTQEYFTHTTAVSIIVGGNRALPGENPRSFASCWQAFPLLPKSKPGAGGLELTATAWARD